MDSSSNDSDLAQRILQAARHRFFRLGLRALTMDDLARDLGVSKKTLYVHFPSKSVIAEQIVDFIGRTMRSRFDKILDDPTLSLAQKLCAIVEVIGANIAQLSPSMLRDLQREAPACTRKSRSSAKKTSPTSSAASSNRVTTPGSSARKSTSPSPPNSGYTRSVA